MSNPGAGDQDDAPLASNKMTLSQHLVVVFLIVAVGILFGMGPVMALVFGGGGSGAAFQDISSDDARELYLMEQRRDRILGLPGRPLRDGPSPYLDWAQSLWMAEIADEQGLMPKGAALDEAVDDFLNTPTRNRDGEETTVRSLLANYHGTEPLNMRDLKRLVQVDAAQAALGDGFSQPPAISAAHIDNLMRMQEDQVQLTQVVLTTAPLLERFREAAANDDSRIADAYESLKTTYFQIPPLKIISAVVVDPALIAPAVAVSSDALETWYVANRDGRNEWIAATSEDGIEWKPLAEVVDQVTEEMRAEIAPALTAFLFQHVITAIEDGAIAAGVAPEALTAEQLSAIVAGAALGPGDDNRLSAPITARVVTEARISEPQRGEASVPVAGIGEIKASSAAGLFRSTVAVGSLQLLEDAVADAEGMDLIVRIDGVEGASSRALDDPAVRDAVVTYLAGRDAYPVLLEQAEAIRAAAASMEGGLAAYFADAEMRARWELEARPEATEADPEPVDPAVRSLGAPALGPVIPAPVEPLVPGQEPPVTNQATRLVERVDSGADRFVVMASPTPRSRSVPPVLGEELPRVVLTEIGEFTKAEMPDFSGSGDPEVAAQIRQMMTGRTRQQVIAVVSELQRQEFINALNERITE